MESLSSFQLFKKDCEDPSSKIFLGWWESPNSIAGKWLTFSKFRIIVSLGFLFEKGYQLHTFGDG